MSFSTARLHASSECSGAEISVNGHSGRDDRRCCIASDADRRSDVCSARHVDEKGLVRLRNVAITADDVFGIARIFLDFLVTKELLQKEDCVGKEYFCM